MVDLNLQRARRQFAWLAAVAAVLGLLSALGARDKVVWALEVAPVYLVVGVVWCRGWAPTCFLSRWMFVHAFVLIVGAHYTYAEVPAGHWVAGWLGQTRNPYDRLGHFMQGLVPALIMREVLLRTGTVRSARVAAFGGILLAGAFTAAYEIFEWFAAVLLGQGAEAFLGTQGFVWDTQADMLCAFLGATFAMFVLAPFHRRALAAISSELPS
jgi:putative membrane protein